MTRINLDTTRTPADSQALLQQVQQAFGATPNMFKAVANANRCEYCLAAHTALGTKAGVSAEALAQAQLGQSADPRTAAALRFALKVVQQRAHLQDADVAALHEHGFDDGQVMELLAHVALNVFTNYVNVAFAVPVDFPRVALK